jgi:4-alpha-glucanotransferase
MPIERASGVLLHLTSLPGPHGCGDLGSAACHFVDWLVAGGQRLWQILPLGGIGAGNSPYMSSSAFAGNVLLVDLVALQQRGWLDEQALVPGDDLSLTQVNFQPMIRFRMDRLRLACDRFQTDATQAELADFEAFCQKQAYWLADYALFMALQEAGSGQSWSQWETGLARRDPTALAQALTLHAQRVLFWKFSQWCFSWQWRALKRYANQRGVRIIGDVPIFIAHQSSDVWSRPELFELDSKGWPTVVAGVPPDGFSVTGQRWGNPLYRWPAHGAEKYCWWTERIRCAIELVDLVRLDHFRGFESYWEIDAGEPTAIHGRWVPAPGDALLGAITRKLGALPIIAEDLGVITPEVDALRQRHGLHGMRVLQFAFGDGFDSQSRYLPHQYTRDSVVYTGTHDNDTSSGWWQSLSAATRRDVEDYFPGAGTDIGWALIRAACASVADMAIYPMQDVLGLSAEHRMNVPGTGEGNWTWRFRWTQVGPEHACRLHRMAQLYGRLH